jgi:hypothetical protein
MANPQLRLKFEVGFSATPASDITTVTWTDITAYVRLNDGVSMTRGRQDETSAVGAGVASFSLDNRDGRFTPGNTSGAYSPNVKLRRPVRISLTSPTVILWTGYVDSWGESWNSGVQAVVRVQASDLWARLSKTTFRSLKDEEILADVPALYYPLTDVAGSTTATNASTKSYAALNQYQSGTGGTLAFGQANSFGADVEDTVAVFTRVDANNGKFLAQVYNPLPELTATLDATFEAYVYIPVTVGVSMLLAQLYNTGASTLTQWSLTIDAASQIAWTGSHGGTARTTMFGIAAGPLNDGAWHHVAVTYDGTTTGDVVLYCDGVAQVTSPGAAGAITFNTLMVGATNLGSFLFNGWVAGVAVYGSKLSATRIAEHASIRNGARGDTSLARFNRAARMALGSWAVNTSSFSPSATMSSQPFKSQSAASIIQGVSDAEGAPSYIGADGVPKWRARVERRTPASAVSIPASAVSAGTGFSTSDQLVVNDVTYSRPGGATYNETDTASVTAYGRLADSKSIYFDSDSQTQSAANFAVNTRSEPQARTGSLTLDLVAIDSTVAIASTAALDVGSVVNVTSVPRGSLTTLSVFVEGVNDTITATSWQRTLNTSPLRTGGATWVLGTPPYSTLGTSTIVGN